MPMVKCPNGCLNGEIYKPHTDKVENCPLCLGTGVVDPDAVCACGVPAFLIKDGFSYCGKDSCLIDLRREKRDRENPPSYTSFGAGYTPYGMY